MHGTIAAFDWNLLLVMDALFLERNVTRAARRVGISQSAMSHALGRLRDHLGDPLFAKTPRGMVPTPRARTLEAPVREAVALVRRTFAEPRPFDPATEERTFTIATTDMGGLVIVPPLLEVLAKAAPLLDLSVRPNDVASLASLRSGELDLLLAIGPLEAADLRSSEVFTDEFVCVRRKVGGRRLPRLTLAKFVATPHVLVSPTGRGDAPVDAALRKVGKKRRVALRLSHFLLAPLVLAQSDYVMTVPTRLAAVFADLLRLHVEPPPVHVPGFAMFMVWHERSDSDPGHRFVRERIADLARRLPRAAAATTGGVGRRRHARSASR